jgi:predicted Zn-dependent protease
LVRLKRFEEALESFRQAAELAPDRARYTYVYAVALYTAKRADDAKNVLMTGLPGIQVIRTFFSRWLPSIEMPEILLPL